MFDSKDEYIAKIEAINHALSDKIADLQKRKMARNNEQSLLWRSRAFYYKKECRKLRSMLREIQSAGA